MKKYLTILICFFCFPLMAQAKTKVTLKECVDGDTAKFLLKDEVVTARFLAIDTPEIKHGKNEAQPYGNEAKEYTCETLKKAGKINIEYDSNSDEKDKYGRILVWVWVDDSLLQEDLVQKGYAKVAYLYGDYKYTSLLQEKEAQAKEKELNIWGAADQISAVSDETMLFIGIGVFIIALLFFLFDQSFRKKTIKKTKQKIEKKIDKEIDKHLKKV